MKRAFFTLVCFSLFSSSVPAQQFFPPHAFDDDEKLNQFTVDWYSKQLNALEESPLWDLSHQSKQEIYRFTWLRSFHHPTAVRVEVRPNGTGLVTWKIASGKGGYEPGTLTTNRSRKLSKQEVRYLLNTIHQVDYWNLPTREKIIDEPGMVTVHLDGAQWIMEETRDGKYKIVDHWSSEKDPIKRLGILMMVDLAHIKLLYQEVY
jgi:hypothetical protein